jgi:hypothetical protein
MTKYRGGHLVGEGIYWNLRNGGVVVKDEALLPGGHDAAYYRLPFFVLFVLGTVLGGVYILLLPVILNVAAIYVAGRRILGGILYAVRRSASFGWRPTEAYLGGKNRKNDREKKTDE